MKSIRYEKLNFWAKNRKNLLMLGISGVGKTAMTFGFFKEVGLSLDTNVAQWSTPLMDFVGPKPSEAGVLFFDNLNDEVALKAAQEIIALRRWRGQEISPTACVWGCYTLAYDESKKERVNVPVNLGDRFEVIVQIPSRVDKAWFIERFGKNVAVAALSWLDGLSWETRESITPRRLEQALQMWLDKGDMRDVLPMSANVIKLMMMLNDAGR